jgi:outer membrane protein assembly factor BamB
VARFRIVVVVVAVFTVFAGAVLKWCLVRRAGAREGSARTEAGLVGTGLAKSHSTLDAGIGAGPPPSDAAVPRAIRALHGDARRTHRVNAVAPRSTPVIAWARDVGGPVEAQVTPSPDERTLYVASLAGTLTALASEDGAVRWSVALGDRAYATPCVGEDGTVFQGSDAKKFVAISPEGTIRWALDTDGDADTGPALLADGTVVFAAGRMVYGVTQRGQVLWRFAAKRKVFAAPAIDESGRVFVASQDHHVYGLGVDHRAIWSVDLDFDVDGAPVVGDDQAVFVGTDGGDIVRLDGADGRIVWRVPVGGYVRGSLSAARNGDVLAGVYGPAPRQVRLRARDGALVGGYGVQGTGAREFGVHGGALEDDRGALLFGTQADDVVAVDESGNLLWRVTTHGDVDAPVTLLSDGTVIVASDDGVVRALRPAR